MNIIHTNQHFEYHENGYTAYLSYVLDGNIYVFNHTVVPTELGGRGIGKILAQHALDFAREHDWQIRIECDFLQNFVDKNPIYQSLL